MNVFRRLIDRLFFDRKQARRNWEELQRLQKSAGDLIAAGHYTEHDGLGVCPHCGYRLSRADHEENRAMASGLPDGFSPRDFAQCPACERVLNIVPMPGPRRG